MTARRTLHLTNPFEHDGQDKLHPKDITYTQTLLSGENAFKQNFHPGPVDGVYGELTAAAAKHAKWLLGYPKWACNMQAGNTLRGFLAGSLKLPATYRLRRRLRAKVVDKNAAVRERMVVNARYLIDHAAAVHYTMGGARFWNLHRPRALPMWSDCSASITCICCWSGAPDPNGLGYNGEGYTGTFLRHCRHIHMSDARIGDFVVWGTGTGHHVAMVIETGSDPLLYSHGSEAGPFAERYSAENVVQTEMGHDYTTWLTVF